MLQTITDTARDIVGSHQAITLFACASTRATQPRRATLAVTSFSDKYADWRRPRAGARRHRLNFGRAGRTATGMSAGRAAGPSRLGDRQDGPTFRPVTGGMLAAPLTGRDGTNLGVIYLSDRYEGDFTHDDEAMLVQSRRWPPIAIENTIYAEEREANRIKDEFLATLSHELRTPLNAILGWTQMLQPGELAGRRRARRGGHRAQRPRQAKLIEDLLDVSRIITGKLRLNVRAMPLRPVVEAAVDAMRPGGRGQGDRAASCSWRPADAHRSPATPTGCSRWSGTCSPTR